MCMTDLRLGRYIKSVRQFKNMAGAETMTIPADRTRIAFSVGAWTASAAVGTMPTLLIDGVFFAALGLNVPFMYFSIKDYGDLVQQAVTLLNGSTPGTQAHFNQYLLDEAMLSAPLSEFER